MILIRIEAPFGSFRKSFARSFAETYPLPPPATVYGMLLSLVGERFRKRHEGVRLAFAFKRAPRVSTTLRKLSRFKYGVPGKQSTLGNAPDYVETLCNIEFLCWIDSENELRCQTAAATADVRSLEDRVVEAVQMPDRVSRYGILSLGLSDDAVNDIQLCHAPTGSWLPLLPWDSGEMELPIWVDHVGSIGTRWRRFHFETEPIELAGPPPINQFVAISPAG